MKFAVTCPYCSKEVLLASSEVGQKVFCPFCHRSFVVTIIEPVDKSEPPIADKSKLSFHPELEQSKQLMDKVAKDLDEMEVEDILDSFYALEELISIYIEEEMGYDPDTQIALLVIASKKQIEISKEVKEHLQKKSSGLPLPAHIGYAVLADIRERQGMYDECIKLCQQALEEGWTGDWQTRLSRCRKTSMIKKRDK